MAAGDVIKVVIDEPRENRSEKIRVLLVDDDDFIHETVELLLAETRYSLTSAESVEKAMMVILSEPPDIIITDAMMPGESGFSLISRVKSLPQASHIPIILWTILEDVNGGVMDASLRADLTATKPFYASDILKSLEDAERIIAYRKIAVA